MSKYFYIETANGDKYYMDAVFNISYQQTGTPTTYAVEAGFDASDGYTQPNDVLSVSGAISRVKFSRSSATSTSLELFEKNMTALKKSGVMFSVNFSDNLNPLQNCLFTSLNLSRSTATGVHSIDVAMTIQPNTVADRAETVLTPKPLEQFEDIVSAKKKSSGNKVETTEAEESNLQRLEYELRPGAFK